MDLCSVSLPATSFKGRRQKVCKDCVINIKNENTCNASEPICEYCNKSKKNSEFSKCISSKICKECKRNHTLDLKMIRHEEKYKDYYIANQEKIIQKASNWNKNNPEKRSIVRKKYRAKHKNELDFRLKENMSVRLRNLVKKNNNKFLDFLQCDLDHLKLWLEFNFTKEMSWNNYGSYWHIDHIIPCSRFDVNVHDEVMKCWHWSNLAPLEAIANASKGNKVIESIVIHYKKQKVFLTNMEKVQRA